MKVVLLQNTMINRERHVAGEVVELEAAMAKNFCKALLAAPYAEIENGELVTDADPEVVVAFAEQIEESEELEQEVSEVAKEEIGQEANVSAENEEENAAEEITQEVAEVEQKVKQPAANKGTKKGKK